MQDTMSSSVNASNDTRWEDEPARPLWSSSGSSEQTPTERALHQVDGLREDLRTVLNLHDVAVAQSDRLWHQVQSLSSQLRRSGAR